MGRGAFLVIGRQLHLLNQFTMCPSAHCRGISMTQGPVYFTDSSVCSLCMQVCIVFREDIVISHSAQGWAYQEDTIVQTRVALLTSFISCP